MCGCGTQWCSFVVTFSVRLVVGFHVKGFFSNLNNSMIPDFHLWFLQIFLRLFCIFFPSQKKWYAIFEGKNMQLWSLSSELRVLCQWEDRIPNASHERWVKGCVPRRLCFLGERVGDNHVSTADPYGLSGFVWKQLQSDVFTLGVTLTALFSYGWGWTVFFLLFDFVCPHCKLADQMTAMALEGVFLEFWVFWICISVWKSFCLCSLSEHTEIKSAGKTFYSSLVSGKGAFVVLLDEMNSPYAISGFSVFLSEFKHAFFWFYSWMKKE